MKARFSDQIRSISLLIFVFILSLFLAPTRAVAGSFREPLLQGPPTTSVGSTDFSVVSVAIVIILIALLGLLFFFVFYWSGKIERTGYLGSLYRNTIEDIEFKRLKENHEVRWNNYGYHRDVWEDANWKSQHPEPKSSDASSLLSSAQVGDMLDQLTEDFLTFERPRYQSRSPVMRYEPPPPPPPPPGINESEGGNNPPGSLIRQQQPPLTDEEKIAAKKENEEKRIAAKKEYEEDKKRYEEESKAGIEFSQKVIEWRRQFDHEANKRYVADLALARTDADANAKLAIDVDMAALQGRGAGFILEFTTVVVIIFAAVILGILRILDAQQIGTLLAAIAGYVLGRATTRAAGSTNTGQPAAGQPAAGQPAAE